MTNKIQVLIVDDEPLARQRLADLISNAESLELLGMATNGKEAVESIDNLDPDLVFLDVQMPGMTGMDVVRKIGADSMPTTIFVTAYDQHAVDAFELAAIDYLLKPFEDSRFFAAVDRAIETIRLSKIDVIQRQLTGLLNGDTQPAKGAKLTYLQRIPVDSRGQIRIVSVDDVDFISSDGPYAEVHAGNDTFVIRERMQSLEEQLDPTVFARIHRSTIVRLDCIETLLVAGGGDYAVKLKDGRKLKVSRNRRDGLADRLGIRRKDG